VEENHVIDWDKAKVVDREAQRQTRKIMLRIILEQLRKKTDVEISKDRAKTRKGRGTRDRITNLRILTEKEQEH